MPVLTLKKPQYHVYKIWWRKVVSLNWLVFVFSPFPLSSTLFHYILGTIREKPFFQFFCCCCLNSTAITVKFMSFSTLFWDNVFTFVTQNAFGWYFVCMKEIHSIPRCIKEIKRNFVLWLFNFMKFSGVDPVESMKIYEFYRISRLQYSGYNRLLQFSLNPSNFVSGQ